MIRLVALAALSAAGLALPAAALDLTGTWTGKYTCTVFDGTTTKVTVENDVLKISQNGDVFAVDASVPFSGVSIADAKHPDTKGEAKLATCSTDNDVANGGDQLVRLAAKVDRTKGKGSLKGSAVFTTVPTSFGTCKWSYQLTDPTDPGATGCM